MMMAPFDVKVEGLEKLERELDRLPDKLAKRALRTAMREAAKLPLNDLRGRVAVRTGGLRQSLAVAVKLKRGAVSAQIGVPKGARPAGRSEGAEYGQILRFLERGTGSRIAFRTGKTSKRSQRFAARGGGIKARRWMQHSFDSTKDRVVSLVSRKLTQFIEKYHPGT